MENQEKERNGEALESQMRKAKSLEELKEICLAPENIGEMIPEDVDLMQVENTPKPSREDRVRGARTGDRRDIVALSDEAIEEWLNKFQNQVLRETIQRLTEEERSK